MKLVSSEPFWLIKNGLLNSYPSLAEDAETDILIVGGGITGSLIAHQCMGDGYSTMLIDRREIAHGSTAASTSMLQYEIDVPLYKLIELIGEKAANECYHACYRSIDDLKEIVQQVRSDSGFRKKESLYFAARKKDVNWLKKEYDVRKKAGFSVRWMEEEDIETNYGLRGSYGGICSEQGGSVDAFQLCHDILAFNHKKGLRIYDKTSIKKTDHRQDAVTVTTDHGYMISAKKIIYCSGYESTELIKDRFVKLLSTYAIVGEKSEGEPSPLRNTLLWNTAEPYMYMRTTDDNRLLIGGEDEEFVNAEKRDKLLYDKSLRLEKYIHKMLPDHEFRTDFSWCGTFGQTKDGLPYIGTHPDFPGAYFVLAFGGNGITFAVSGMEVISFMLKNKSHPLEAYFRFRR